MKYRLLLLISLCNLHSFSQEIIGISMGSSYQYDIYYSLEEGITASPDRNNWELAFSTNAYDNNIRINSGNAVSLYEVSSSVSDWENINSIGAEAIQLRNSNTDWTLGAFVVNSSGGLNYGWGDYNMANHTIEGSRIYIITYGSSTKKMIVNSKTMGTYYITLANLDGTQEEQITVDAASYSDKQFVYYSLESNEIIDREPSSWDLLFTKYEDDLNNDIADPLSYEQAYFVTGVLTNGNLIAQYDGNTEDSPSFMSLDTTRNINTIGWDWKEYTGSYSMVPNRSYFIADQDENKAYKIIFESFSGGSSGNVSFSLMQSEVMSNLSVDNAFSLNEVNIYPNPSQGIFNIDLNENSSTELLITDLNGRLIKSKKINQNTLVDLSNESSGFYFVRLKGKNINSIQKIAIFK